MRALVYSFVVVSTASLHLPAVRPLPKALRAQVAPKMGFWDKIMYGEAGKPPPPAPPAAPAPPPTLQAVFDQLDVNNDGVLSSEELHRAFVIIGVAPSEYDEILDALGCDAESDGCEPGSTITYDAFEQRLPTATRVAIEKRLGEDGKLPSLYVPPEAWTDTRTQAERMWEQKVQFQAQRGGNKVRQNEILADELGKS